MIDIEPATYTQVIKAGDDWVIVEQDVCEIVKRLNEIDPRLRVRVNPVQKIYALYTKEVVGDEEKEYLINTFKNLDSRVVTRVEQILNESYDYVKELEAIDDKAEKDFEYELDQKMGDNAERLAHAIRKDLQVKDRIFIG